MRKVAVVGVGETKFSGPQEKTSVELFGEAATEAINESNLKPKDIQALFLGNCLGDFSEGKLWFKLLPLRISVPLTFRLIGMMVPVPQPA